MTFVDRDRRTWLRFAASAPVAWAARARAAHPAAALTGNSVLIGIDAEFGHATSTSAQAIERGAAIAIDEINAAGGVLKQRPLALIKRDNRGVPTRATENLRELGAMQDVVAVLTGKFSPAVVECLPLAHEIGIPLLAAWSAADEIIDHRYRPSYSFRLSLRDDWALAAMIRHAARKRAARLALLLPNTSWGRSSQRAAQAYVAARPQLSLVHTASYNSGDKSFAPVLRAARQAGAQALLLVANEREGALVVGEMAALPAAERLPIAAHWGVTGGEFTKLAGPALHELDFGVVQTFSFVGAGGTRAQRVLAALRAKYGVHDARHIDSPVGVAHAYDLVHILARAITLAGTIERAAVRSALERVRDVDGLVRRYAAPFTADRHEALSPEQVFMAAYARDGALLRLAA
jgi:branched-chain amino acid transport system substrate-binding protein